MCQYVLILEAMIDGELDGALAYAMHCNGMLRNQDILQSLVRDFSHAGSRTVRILGGPGRGGEVKTGVDQGVEFSVIWIVLMLRRFLQGRPHGAKMFNSSEERYQKNSMKTLVKFIVAKVRGVYVWRHSGAVETVRDRIEDEKSKESIANVLG